MPRVPVLAPGGPKLAPLPRTGLCYAFPHVLIANTSFLDEKCSCCLVTLQDAFLSLLLSVTNSLSFYYTRETSLWREFVARILCFPLGTLASYVRHEIEKPLALCSLRWTGFKGADSL
jgi:hypothetical protein